MFMYVKAQNHLFSEFHLTIKINYFQHLTLWFLNFTLGSSSASNNLNSKVDLYVGF